MTTSPHGIQTFPLSPCFFGVTLYSQQILQIHTVSNTNTCFSHTCTHNQLQCPAALVSSLHHQKQQQHSIRTKLLRRRWLVAQVLPIEMQTLWYGNWQLQKTARIHTSMHWNHLRNVRWDGTSSQDNTDKWTKPARLGRVREGAKVERVERRRRRSRGRRGEGERGRKTVVCPFPLTPISSYNSLSQLLLWKKTHHGLKCRIFKVQHLHWAVKLPTTPHWQGDKISLSIPRKYWWACPLFLSRNLAWQKKVCRGQNMLGFVWLPASF